MVLYRKDRYMGTEGNYKGIIWELYGNYKEIKGNYEGIVRKL